MSTEVVLPKHAKLESEDSDCEIVGEKNMEKVSNSKSIKLSDRWETVNVHCNAVEDYIESLGTNRKRPYESETVRPDIELIELDDEDTDSGVGSSKSINGKVASSSLISLAQSPTSSNGEKSSFKTNKDVSDQVETTIDIGLSIARRPVGNGLPPEYARNLFRPVDNILKKCSKEMCLFSRQIWRHFSENLQNDMTFTWKMRVRYILHETISELYPGCHLIAVGSTINGCGSYNSDMDLCLCVPDQNGAYNTQRKYTVSTLRRIHRRLIGLPIVRHCSTIPAKVPIIKMWFHKPYEALEVDLNINNTAGIYNSYLLHYYSRVDDRCSAMCILVKHWAKVAGIGDAFNGYFNSYSLILMVVHFLQVACDPPILPNLQKLYPDFFAINMPLKNMTLFGELPKPLAKVSQNQRQISELLVAFFKYYTDFDYRNNGISVADACIFPRRDLPMNTRRFKIFIEEPFERQNTARCITSDDAWARIRHSFLKANQFFFARKAAPPDLDAFLRYFSSKNA